MTVAAVLERVSGTGCWVECVDVVMEYFMIFKPNGLAVTASTAMVPDTFFTCCTVPHIENYFFIYLYYVR